MNRHSPGALAVAAFLLAAGSASHAAEDPYRNSVSANGGGAAGNPVAPRNATTPRNETTPGNAAAPGAGEPGTPGGKAGHFAVLSGGNEVSDDGRANVGDPDARGTATVTVDAGTGRLCFAMIVDNIDAPVAAHIHKAPPGQNGPIVVPLTVPNRGDPGATGDCIGNVDAAVLKAIHEQPWAYYVNVHTGLFPAGAVRGQLF
jgi:hypothetical protein